MNQNAQKWVETLRSGEFEQGTNQLRTGDNAYCCLGVACELYRRETGEGEWKWAGEKWTFGLAGAHSLFMPMKVKEWLGLVSDTGAYDNRKTSLARRNDGGDTFQQIADTIEAQPEGLFDA